MIPIHRCGLKAIIDFGGKPITDWQIPDS